MSQVSHLTAEELQFLQEAARYLETPGLLMRLASLVGRPAEGLLNALPTRAQAIVGDATRSALERSLEWAVQTLPQGEASRIPGWSLTSGRRFHLALTATTGAVGGLFGLAGAALEVPATTTCMLRSIAEIAKQHGSDPRDPQTRLQCLMVFSFGSPTLETMESAYFSSRLAMAFAVRDAAQYIARHSAKELSAAIAHQSAPALVRLINQIASRFQIVVTQKLAAQAVPIAGAALGSLINAAFTDHFNRVAEYHFGIVALERQHGQEVVQAAYREACQKAASPL